MLKDYLKKKKLSLSRISKECGIPYSTLNDLSVGKVDFDGVRVGTAVKLMGFLDLSFEDLYAICKYQNGPDGLSWHDGYGAEIKNKALYVRDPKSGRELKVCDVTANNRPFLKKIAQWAWEFNKAHPNLDSDTMELFGARACLLQREAQAVAAVMLDQDGKAVDVETAKTEWLVTDEALKERLQKYEFRYDDIKKGTYVMPDGEEFWINPVNRNLTYAAHKRLMSYGKISRGGNGHEEERTDPSDK